MPSLAELEEKFRRLGVDVSAPGFYDAPQFMRAERDDPTLLVDYARYVRSLVLSPDYLEHARTIVREAANFLYSALVADGRTGACIDVSATLQRFLERQGIWCYFIGGGLKIRFPLGARLPNHWFWPLMHERNPAFTGHAWICAPPFHVVDLSLSAQPYAPQEQEFLRGFVLEDQCGPSEATSIGDLMENELLEQFVAATGRFPSMEDLPQIAPGLREFMAEFPSCSVAIDGVHLKYIPVRTSAPDLPFEHMTNLRLSGRYPIQLYEEFQRARG